MQKKQHNKLALSVNKLALVGTTLVLVPTAPPQFPADVDPRAAGPRGLIQFEHYLLSWFCGSFFPLSGLRGRRGLAITMGGSGGAPEYSRNHPYNRWTGWYMKCLLLNGSS